MLNRIVREIDTSKDGKIQYDGTLCAWLEETKLTRAIEFRAFVQRADRKLFELFHNVDKNGDGKVDLKELQIAFRTAGLTVSNARLAEFFNDMDCNNDGYVTFGEWRYVLLFFLQPLSIGMSPRRGI